MAKALDLDEQEQLDQIKHFWKTWGNLISWVLIAVLGGYAAWNGYQYWQRQQSSKASALFDEVEKSAQSGDVAKLDAFIEGIDRALILETVRTGVSGIGRGERVLKV